MTAALRKPTGVEPNFDKVDEGTGASFTSRKLDLISALLVDPRLLASDFKVAVSMLQFMNSQTGALYPSIETVAEIVHMSPRNVRKCLERLRVAKWLQWTRGNRQLANEYEFDLTNLEAMLDYRLSLDEGRRERKILHRRTSSDRNHSSPQKILTGTPVPLQSGTTVPLASGTLVPPNTLSEHRKGTPEEERAQDREPPDSQYAATGARARK